MATRSRLRSVVRHRRRLVITLVFVALDIAAAIYLWFALGTVHLSQ